MDVFQTFSLHFENASQEPSRVGRFIYLGSWLQRFQFMESASMCLGLWCAVHRDGRVDEAELLSL